MDRCADCGKFHWTVVWSQRFLSHLCDECYLDAAHEISDPHGFDIR